MLKKKLSGIQSPWVAMKITLYPSLAPDSALAKTM